MGHGAVPKIILILFLLSCTFLCYADQENYNHHEVDIDERMFVSSKAKPSSVDSTSCRIESSSGCILIEPSVLVKFSFSQLNREKEFSWPEQTDWVILKGKYSQ